ncbi:hypothetical protein [Mucilaginibacter sp.]|uniref:hypothetical protein n=1 Tax=Mucilaginibacter sp. TaxID=1882438 RepID=UPI003563DB6C
MKTRKHPLPDNHTGVAEIDGDDVILYIERNHLVFFGLFTKRILVWGKERFRRGETNYDKEIEGTVFIGGYSIPRIYTIKYRNIETFNIRAELDRMYSEYAAEKKRRDEWNKKLNNFTCI